MRLMYAMLLCSCAIAPKMEGNLRQCLEPTIVVAGAWIEPAYVEAFKRGVEWWGDAFVWGGRTNIETKDAGEGFVLVGFEELGEGVCGITTIKSDGRGCITKAVVKVAWECSRDLKTVEEIVRHELGHTLGYDHAGYGVMEPTIDAK